MTIELVATILNVKCSVPSTGARWRAGMLNIDSQEVKGLERVVDGLRYQPSANEKIFFQTGLQVQDNADQKVVLNRFFNGLSIEDFGKNLNCTVEIKTKIFDDKKAYTFLSITPTEGRWEKEMKINSPKLKEMKMSHPDSCEEHNILGTDAKIYFSPIKAIEEKV